MRVIHNLTHPENTVIDSASDVAAAIKSIEHLLPHSNDILNFLKEENKTISLFSSWQVWEEKIKAHLITRSDAWKNKIQEVEKHGYFNGQIGFILKFAGILEFFYDNNHCDWPHQNDIEYFKKFSDYANKASKVFEESYENRLNDKNFVFERAVLTKGDYLTTTPPRKNLLSTNQTKNNIKRDHSWKRLLRIFAAKDYPQERLYAKQVFDDERFDINNLESSLESICKDRTNTWRDYFISCPSLINYCQQGFIRFDNKNSIRLYKQSQSNFYQRELRSYCFYLELKNIKINISPFEKIWYNSVQSISLKPCAVIDGWHFNNTTYAIDIRFLPQKREYEVRFFPRDNTNVPDKIKNNLPDEYKPDNKFNDDSFIWRGAGKKIVIKSVQNLCNAIKSIQP